MQLRDFQENFKQTILEPYFLNSNNEGFARVFQKNHGISLENRIKVYRSNIINSLTQTTMSALPMTEKLVGRDFLEQAVREYVSQNMPQQGHLTLYGITFPDFIKTYEPARSLPHLHDVAKLEWVWRRAYNAKDDLPLDEQVLTKIDTKDMPRLQFLFRDSFSLIKSEYPLDRIINFYRYEDSLDILDLHKRECNLMIYRPSLKVESRRLDDTEYLFLKSLQKGHTIYETAGIVLEKDPSFHLADYLQKHFDMGTFAGYDIRDVTKKQPTMNN
ncbi:MAG: putative DNA-binding domain-containing protein [Alphaproteobacteria bacterium]